jgi:hypothetical protein
MDYTRGAQAVDAFEPGAYDVEAVKYLYGMSEELPSQPFCTDDDMAFDADCMQFDFGTDPLVEAWEPRYRQAVSIATQIGTLAPLVSQLEVHGIPMVSYVRVGGPEKDVQAWNLLTNGFAAPLTDAQRADPAYAAVADELMQWLFGVLYSDSSAERTGPQWPYSPTVDPIGSEVVGLIVDQLYQHVINSDGVRSIRTRRLAVDTLVKIQSIAAYRSLLNAQTLLRDQLTAGTLDDDSATLTGDLLARINAAVDPYFY